ncbi:MAG: hypothetical protein E6767_12265 [Dysgonomonas sp.]|nr:hypothetical protein [Dysgonomonas sp.]
MKKFCLTILSLMLLTVVYFSSCSSVEDYSDDNEKPTVSNVFFNVNDTIVYEGHRVNINRDSTVAKDVHIIPIGKWMYISGHFQDNRALSTFSVRMDTTAGNGYKKGNAELDIKDSIHYSFLKLGSSIFRKTDTIVNRSGLLLIPEYDSSKGDTVYTREGLRDLQLKVLDMAGNSDTLYFKVMLLNRKTIYEKYSN